MDMAELDTAAIQLLGQSKIILDAREKTLAPLGASFNVFSILNMEANEVDTHSRMLFELLSSEGSHGMGERFLRLFLTNPFRMGPPSTESTKSMRQATMEGLICL